jgi:hypothetical protein
VDSEILRLQLAEKYRIRFHRFVPKVSGKISRIRASTEFEFFDLGSFLQKTQGGSGQKKPNLGFNPALFAASSTASA